MKSRNYFWRFNGRRLPTAVAACSPQLLASGRRLMRGMIKMTKFKFTSVTSLIILFGMATCWYILVRPPWSGGNYISSQNYFRQTSWSGSSQQRDFLVDNGKCRIPNLDIWSAEVGPFINRVFKPVECEHEIREGTINGLTFVRKQAIVINEPLLRETLGLALDDIDCCYQTIDRVQQNYENYDGAADNIFQYSDVCHPMTSLETAPSSGFTKVTCRRKSFLSWFWNAQIHTDFHLLATFEATSRDISEKHAFWRKRNGTRPPNVLLLGIDSASRMNFRRFMPKTIQVLEDKLGAVEMGGYTKVGDNTFPNFVPLLSSYSVDELVDICYKTELTAQDDCPYIWRNFSNANYLTAHVEDAPLIAVFNYNKAGFVAPPVDIYPRAWMLAAYGGSWKSMQCVDSQRPDQIVLRYLVDLVELADNLGLPFFFTTWLTDLTHEYVNSLQSLDAVMSQALLILRDRGHLKDTVLLVMSDHGYRFFPIRKTTSGWYEDKLPALWMALPETLKKSNPTWEDNLRHNSRQLATPFDVHESLKDILEISTKLESQKPKSLRGRSLFDTLPQRDCAEAGVPSEFCACGTILEYTGNPSNVEDAANVVAEKINKELPYFYCSSLWVDSVTATGIIKDGLEERLVIAIKLAPEDVEVETVFAHNNASGNRKWQVVGVLRTNRVDPCVLLGGDVGGYFCQCWWANWLKMFDF